MGLMDKMIPLEKSHMLADKIYGEILGILGILGLNFEEHPCLLWEETGDSYSYFCTNFDDCFENNGFG